MSRHVVATADFDHFAEGMGRLEKVTVKQTFQSKYGVHPMAIVIPLLLTMLIIVLKSFKVRCEGARPMVLDAVG